MSVTRESSEWLITTPANKTQTKIIISFTKIRGFLIRTTRVAVSLNFCTILGSSLRFLTRERILVIRAVMRRCCFLMIINSVSVLVNKLIQRQIPYYVFQCLNQLTATAIAIDRL